MIVANEEGEWLKDFLCDCARDEALHAENDDGGDVADDVKDFCGDGIFDAINLLILLDEHFIHFEDNGNSEGNHDEDNDAGTDIEVCENEERTEEPKGVLGYLECI